MTSKQNINQDDCYSQVFTSENRQYDALTPSIVLISEYAITLQIFTSYIYAIAFIAGLNDFQVGQAN